MLCNCKYLDKGMCRIFNEKPLKSKLKNGILRQEVHHDCLDFFDYLKTMDRYPIEYITIPHEDD